MDPKFKDLLNLIKEGRLRPSTTRGMLIESESDKGRIVNSSAFRRLQQKAQVFPLEANAAVRSRLTHSIEVSQVGRHLAQKVIKACQGNSLDYEQLSAFVNTVESACLVHDIGNPPFGHFGEAAIQDWFNANLSTEQDLLEFDGNPQGFRILTRLAGSDDFGLNLTATLLLSSVKYPWHTSNKPQSEKKIGIFSTEWEKYRTACDMVGWEPGKRFPIMLLMDTADEIAYSLSDIEDGLEKGIIKYADLRAEIDPNAFCVGTHAELIKFKTATINEAVEIAAQEFHSNLQNALDGKRIDLLPSGSQAKEQLKKIKSFVRRKIYSDRTVEKIELAGYSVVHGLLTSYKSILLAQTTPHDEFERLLKKELPERKPYRVGLEKDMRLRNMLPEAYIDKYRQHSVIAETTRRAHLITDFISGMTDDYALETFQVLQGIKIA